MEHSSNDARRSEGLLDGKHPTKGGQIAAARTKTQEEDTGMRSARRGKEIKAETRQKQKRRDKGERKPSYSRR